MPESTTAFDPAVLSAFTALSSFDFIPGSKEPEIVIPAIAAYR